MARTIKTLKYLSEAELIAINEEMVAKFGGLHGVRDLNFLRLAIGRPQMSAGLQDAYKTIFDKAAAMFHSIINNHPFLDGNKRTSLFSAILLLEYNGWSVEFSRKEAIKFTLLAHNNDWGVEQIAKWLKSHSTKS
ncbi:MAG: type II toxin-antitoxin system death-on-curing family toxin [Candidatus Curtissbacteria bacterium]